NLLSFAQERGVGCKQCRVRTRFDDGAKRAFHILATLNFKCLDRHGESLRCAASRIKIQAAERIETVSQYRHPREVRDYVFEQFETFLFELDAERDEPRDVAIGAGKIGDEAGIDHVAGGPD